MFIINTLPSSIKSIKCHFEDINIEFNGGDEDSIYLPEYAVAYEMDDDGNILLTQVREKTADDIIRINVTPSDLKNIDIRANMGTVLFNSVCSSPRTNISLVKGCVRVEKSNFEYLLLRGDKLNMSIKSSVFSDNVAMSSEYAMCFLENTEINKLYVSSSSRGKVLLSDVEAKYIKARLNSGTCEVENTLASGIKIITTGHGLIKVDAKNINDLYIRTEQGKIEIAPDYMEGYKGLFLQTSLPIQGVIPPFGQEAQKILYLQSKSGSVKLR